jgi:hypothetical protein
MDPGEFAELAVGWSPAAVIWGLAALKDTHGGLPAHGQAGAAIEPALRRFAHCASWSCSPITRDTAAPGRRSFQLAVMSSHSNPHGIALNLVARRFGVPIVLITHVMPIRPLARLHYDVAIHECEASKRLYAHAGCRMGCTLIKSRRAEHAPMRLPVPVENLTIGVFLSKDPVEERVVC